jgi:PAS domain S-box-containing protein
MLESNEFERDLDERRETLLGIIREFEKQARGLHSAEQVLREREETIRALLENASQGIITVAADGSINEVNAMAERLFGFSRAELQGQPLEMLLPEQYRDQHVRQRSSYFHGPRSRPMGVGLDLLARRKDGSTFPVEISLSHVSTKHGILAVAFVSDITERKRAEEALIGQAQELARSNADLQQFAYITSHDLQEPLRMIASYLQLLSLRYHGKLDSSADQYIVYAVDGVRRMQALIDDLLAFSRVANVESLPRAAVSLDTVVRWALNNLEVSVQESQARIIHDPLPTVWGNQVQLVQLFQNLIGNSIRYRKRNQPLEAHIEANQSDNCWTVRVRDNGIGIAPEYREQVFGLFKRLHRDKSGTGIGLAICKKIVEKHDGRIWIEGDPGEGTTIVFTLPAVPAGAELSEAAGPAGA